jgi:RimJ/RimL family protein N-acetyltransferase
MTTLADLWPPAGLSLTCGDLELRIPDDGLLVALAELAAEGVHDPGSMPFFVPWTRGTPTEVARSVLTYQWGTRSRMAPDAWALELAVLRRGEVLGIQSISSTHFRRLRSAESGSWLGRRFQGQGVGTRMRLMVLHLLFDGLGAERATTGAFEDNPASNAVTRRIGYVANGSEMLLREDVPSVNLRYVLTREAWSARPDEQRLDIAHAGLDEVREFLQIT